MEKFIKTFANDATKKAFLGIYSIDTLPRQLPHLPILLIVNTDTHNLPGQHWKAVYISSERLGEIFDSLALPVSIHLQRWMNNFTRKWTTNASRIQHPLSASCGAFVLYFILTRLSKRNMYSCLKVFSNKNMFHNDNIVRGFVKDLSVK